MTVIITKSQYNTTGYNSSREGILAEHNLLQDSYVSPTPGWKIQFWWGHRLNQAGFFFSQTRKHIKACLFFHFQTVIATWCKSSRYLSWKWSEPQAVQSKQIFKAILQTFSCVRDQKSVRGIRSPNQDAAVLQTNVPSSDPVAVKACGQITLLEKQKHCRGLQKNKQYQQPHHNLACHIDLPQDN